MFIKQFKAIQAKNWLINYRTKQFIRENISVIILSAFIIVTQRSDPNNFQSPFYLAIAITSYSRAIAVHWLQEKESHQRELQRIMGVSYLSYLLSWLVYFIVNGAIISTVMMLITRFLIITEDTNFEPDYGFFNIVALYFVFVLGNIGYVLFLSCFFSKAKTGAQAITFLQLITNFLYYLVFASDVANSKIATTFLGIFPQMSFNMGLSVIAFKNSSYDFGFNFTYSQAIITLLIDFAVFTLLALYLNEIIPNEMGTHKHPLFFLGCGRKDSRVESNELSQPLMNEQLGKQNGQSAQSSAKYQQFIHRESSPLIKMRRIVKRFGDKTVINDMSINFYGGQIFCLLGHNGAGKSTTINLLTGLIQVNEGNIDILGLSYPNDVDQIRKDIGLCLQYNVLYDNLTIEDHLRYYYRVKNKNDQNMEQAITNTIVQCALINERGKLAKNLSGGNKRKLCLANSLIGGSRIIFLDQPSSGLDPNSRHSIWDILKNISRMNRCIILTTHHLQQAEQLSRRIAIMSKGKLIILGSPSYITNHFSVGYHVVVTLSKEQPKAAELCRQIITNNIENCTQDKQTAKNTLKFILPLQSLPHFSKTFKALQDAKIGQISVYVSNLQDAFVKIGQQEQSFNQGFQKLQPLALNQQKQQSKNNQLILPQVHCSYSFASQFKAVFLRKLRVVLRSFSTIVSVIMPTAFISIGVLVVCIAIKYTNDDPVDKITLDRIRLFVLSYFMVWAFIFNTSSYCGNIVQQRQKKFKYLSNVSGLRRMPYWTANYVFDLLLFFIPLIIFFIITLAIGEQGQFITKFAGYLISVLLLFGISFIGYSYLFSFIFQKSSTAFRFFPFLNLIFFYFVPMIPSAVDAGGFLAQYLMPLLSPFVALTIFFNTKQIVGSDMGQTLQYNLLWVSYLCLVIQAIVYMIAVLFLQNLRFSLKSKQNIHVQNQVQQRPVSIDSANAPIKVNNLNKMYGNGNIAIRNNSFSVSQGQIFGLLGPNGAGKSTSFNIITAAIPKTTGSVKLFEQQVNKGIMDIFQQVGVCPQYNPLYQKLTLREHLQYFAQVKGIPSIHIPSTINFYGQLLSLNQYMDVKAGVLSGGNKRKMCVAMAMIGNPKVAFFDQPSAGVDPISRRFLWKSLSAATSTKKTAMVLTTHSMNEAQTLCSRIGILIRGQFVCLDTPKALKEEYGKGYRVNVMMDPQNQTEIEEIVKNQFGEVTVERVQTDNRLVVFVIKSQSFCLSRAFGLFENKLKQSGKINSYQVKEATLQQVFIHLSRLQPYVEEQQYKEPWNILCWEWGSNGCQLNL